MLRCWNWPKKAGKATGNVSTAELQDATPAAQFAHVTGRKCYGRKKPVKCEVPMHWKRGRGSITEQMIEGRADVTLGGGAASFSQVAKAGEWKDQSLRDQALARGYVIVENLDDLNAIKHANQQKPYWAYSRQVICQCVGRGQSLLSWQSG